MAVESQESGLYTKAKLLENIHTALEVSVDNAQETEMDCRDVKHKLKVLQFILYMKLPPYDFDKNNTEDIKEAIEVYVDGDEFMFGYTFFLSSNKNFDYSWSYLRKQTDKYINFLLEAYRFISYVIFDINTLKPDICRMTDLHIELNELFAVKFIDDEPFVETTVHWNKFHQINNVKNGYYLSVKKGEATLLTYHRKYSNQLKPFQDNIKAMIDIMEQKDKA